MHSLKVLIPGSGEHLGSDLFAMNPFKRRRIILLTGFYIWFTVTFLSVHLGSGLITKI